MGTITRLAKLGYKGVKTVTPIAALVQEGTDTPRDADLAVVGPDAAAVAATRDLLGGAGAPADAARVTVALPGDDPHAIAELFARRRTAGLDSVAVLVGDPASRARRADALTRDGRVESSQLLHLNSLGGDDAVRLQERVVRAFGADATALGRRNPALRPVVGRLIVQESARKAAMVGALPVGAADMPALGLLQVRMLARLAAVHDRRLGPERVLEAAAVIAAGFGWRVVGRAGTRALPGWLAGGGVAYAGTRAIGEAALARLQAGHDPIDAGPLDAVRPQFDRLLGRLGRR